MMSFFFTANSVNNTYSEHMQFVKFVIPHKKENNVN